MADAPRLFGDGHSRPIHLAVLYVLRSEECIELQGSCRTTGCA
jgi:hypothetical protein